MAEINSFQTVTDGSQLNEGYFNGIYTQVNTNIPRLLGSGSGSLVGDGSTVKEMFQLTTPAAITAGVIKIFIITYSDAADDANGLYLGTTSGATTYTVGGNVANGRAAYELTIFPQPNGGSDSTVIKCSTESASVQNDATFGFDFSAAEDIFGGYVGVNATTMYYHYTAYLYPY